MMKLNRILTYYYLTISATMLFSCGDEATIIDEQGQTKSGIVRLTVSDGGMTRAGGQMNIDNLKTNGFKLDVIDVATGKDGDTRTVTYADDAWTISPKAYWSEDNAMRFWAYSNETATTCDFTTPGKDATQLTFTYPKAGQTPDAQTDVMFASTSKQFSENDNEARIEFKHAMAKVAFDVSAFTMPAGYTKVEYIALQNVKTSGQATFDGTNYSWSNVSGNADFTISNTGDCFLIVPQNIKDASLTVKISGADKDPIYMQASLAGADYTMKAGMLYSFKLTMSDYHLFLTLSVKDWDDDNKDINVANYQVASPITYDAVHSTILDSEKEIIIKNGLPVTGSFKMSQPVGAQILLALDGNVDAFTIENRQQEITADGTISVRIRPAIDDPKKTYKTHLHVFLINSDGTTQQIDNDALGAYKDYTIVLTSN